MINCITRCHVKTSNFRDAKDVHVLGIIHLYHLYHTYNILYWQHLVVSGHHQHPEVEDHQSFNTQLPPAEVYSETKREC